MSRARSVRTDADDFSRKQSGMVSFEGWRTRKSIASSYRTYQVSIYPYARLLRAILHKS